MRLESARALKEELCSYPRRRTTALARAAVMLGACPGYSSGSDGPGPGVQTKSRRCLPPEIALGIAPGRRRGDWKLAVRLQTLAPGVQTCAAYIAGKARDEVDIRFIGKVHTGKPQEHHDGALQCRTRPFRPGCSVGHYGITAGTIGGFVVDRDSQLGILSNNHVLAASNVGKTGDDILQPGPLDGGRREEDVIGNLERYVRLTSAGDNLVDAAYCTLHEDLLELEPVYGKWRLRGVRKAEDITPDMAVWKIGRTTGLTRGRVSAIEVLVSVDYDGTLCWFQNQLELVGQEAPFSRPGDSGAFILGTDGLGIGLLFAGSEKGGEGGAGRTYANPLETALGMLGLNIHEAG